MKTHSDRAGELAHQKAREPMRSKNHPESVQPTDGLGGGVSGASERSGRCKPSVQTAVDVRTQPLSLTAGVPSFGWAQIRKPMSDEPPHGQLTNGIAAAPDAFVAIAIFRSEEAVSAVVDGFRQQLFRAGKASAADVRRQQPQERAHPRTEQRQPAGSAGGSPVSAVAATVSFCDHHAPVGAPTLPATSAISLTSATSAAPRLPTDLGIRNGLCICTG
jgi:hypothetical protein